MGAVILMRRALPYGQAELVEWNWRSPLDLVVREEQHMIEMSLPPFATEGVAGFPGVDPARFHFMGEMFVRPAGVDLHARSVGGRIRVVRLAVDPDGGGPIRSLAFDAAHPDGGMDLRDGILRVLLGRIRDELVRPSSGSDALVQAYADALLLEASQSLEKRRRIKPSSLVLADWQFDRVIARMASSDTPPSVAELAQLCGYSIRHFNRLYCARTGESPQKSIERVRTRRAMTMLSEARTPAKAIADALGFAHDSAFSTAFRRAVGMSPGEWRRRRV